MQKKSAAAVDSLVDCGIRLERRVRHKEENIKTALVEDRCAEAQRRRQQHH